VTTVMSSGRFMREYLQRDGGKTWTLCAPCTCVTPYGQQGGVCEMCQGAILTDQERRVFQAQSRRTFGDRP
jgi:hypothetical protein